VLGLGCAFGGLDVEFDYATHALVFRAHFLAKTVQLDGIDQPHLAFGVHETIADELLADLGALRFNLCLSVLTKRQDVCSPYMLQSLLVFVGCKGWRRIPAERVRSGGVPIGIELE